MTYSRERLGEILVTAGLLSTEQLGSALLAQEEYSGKIGELLVHEGILSEEQIAQALADQKGLAHVNLATVSIDRQAALALPLRVCRRHAMIPIALEGETLTVAMADPLDIEAVDDAQLMTGYHVLAVVAAATQIRLAIEKYVAGADVLQELELVERGNDSVDVVASGDDDSGVAVVRVVNQIIREAVLERASDIHFEPDEQGIRVRYRVDGVLREAAGLPKSSQAELLSRVKVMADLDITERRRPQDGRLSVRVAERSLDVRVATLPTPRGEAITLRILDGEVAFHPIEDIGMNSEDLKLVRSMLSKPYGALFVAGPTGSGKSTTLYALLSSISTSARKIITVEDPIEYTMDGITQIAVNQKVNLTFAAGLRTILRADPDIVMVGEVRDPETAEIAVRAALTGHLVLTSIHTNDAPSALTRLTDMGVPPYITASGLLGAVSQRLVRQLCPHCKREAHKENELLRAIGFPEAELESLVLYEAVGCERCGMTGYRGRLGVFEVMEFTPDMHAMFLRHAASAELREAAIARGMRTLRQDALRKVALGLTTLDEVERVVV
ncbi:MAG: ATPase, T2SS/T4P/T4SS family [Coriobacteriia bacterium]|nr:ATPase, T2SS/T4P/T4SS family [Coriobacteriia bacterium]